MSGLGWAIPVRQDPPELALRSRNQVAVLAVLLATAGIYVFNGTAEGAALVLQPPIVMTALLDYCAYRMPHPAGGACFEMVFPVGGTSTAFGPGAGNKG